jgi:hypothetical protein
VEPSSHSSCTICGKLLGALNEAFALTQTLGEDRLRIYHWNHLAERVGLRGACCASHVRELVIHWMVTANLNYPFANSTPNPETGQDWHASPQSNAITPMATPVGELAVDHDSVSRLLQTNPASLVVILDELDDALQKSLEENSEMLAIADLPDGVIHHF